MSRRTASWDPDPVESALIAMAECCQNGQTWGVGMGTGLPGLAIKLAVHGLGRRLRMYSPSQASYISQIASYPDESRRVPVQISEVFNEDLGPRYGEFFKPAQIDPMGRLNISKLGGSTLAGYAGLAEAIVRYDTVYMYTLKHSRAIVQSVESVTAAIDHSKQRATLVTEEGRFAFRPESESLSLTVQFPTTSLDTLKASVVPIEVGHARPISRQPELLAYLRSELDPHGVRYLEAPRLNRR